jgi:hypothetical protein
VPQLGLLLSCLLASQRSVIFPNGSYLSLGPSKAKGGGAYNKGVIGQGFDSYASSFLLGSSELDSGLREASTVRCSGGAMVAGLVVQVPRCGGPQISFLLLFH